jgi:hypothetical protein
MGIFNRIKEVIRTIRFSASPRLYGRYSAGAGEGQEIGIGEGLTIEAGVLKANAAAIAAETAARIAGDAIGSSAPSNGVAATVTISPTGSNNDIIVTARESGVSGNDLTIALAIDAAIDRTQLTVSEIAGDVVVTSGDKRVMRITGTLTSNGSEPASFPDIPYTGLSGGKPEYSISIGLDVWVIYWDNAGGTWNLELIRDSVSQYAYYTSTDPVATPDLVTTWTPSTPATGTPIVTAHPALASHVISLINAAAISITAANAAANDGTGSIAAVSQTPLTGGAAGTTAPPYIRTANDKLYIQQSGIWKEADLNNLS